MLEIRNLTENELPDIWSIDRREAIENIYYFREGELVLGTAASGRGKHWRY